MRVQIPAYTDRWMMGDRYGEVVKYTKRRNATGLRSDLRVRFENEQPVTIAHVKLDKSGKTIRVYLNDCTVVS